MGCVTVCGVVEGGALADAAAVVLAALAFAVLAALVAAAVSVVLGALPVVVPVFLAALVPLGWVTWRLIRYGSPAGVFRRHRKVRAPVARQAALPAGSSLRALEAPKVIPGQVLTGSVREKMKA